MKIVVVSPHRDDAAFSLGLGIEAWCLTGVDVQVLNCFTQSEYAPYSDAETLHPNDRVSFVSALRQREDEAWNKLLGRRIRWTDLDLLDAPLRLASPVHEAMVAEIRPGDRAVARVSGAIAKLIRTGEANGVAILLPLAIGGHVDHRVVREAGIRATEGRPVALAFYEDLPYAARLQTFEEIDAAVVGTGLPLRPTFAHRGSGDLMGSIHRKLREAECYDSQIDSSEAHQIAEFCRRYGGRERIWVNEAWMESAAGLLTAEEAA